LKFIKYLIFFNLEFIKKCILVFLILLPKHYAFENIFLLLNYKTFVNLLRKNETDLQAINIAEHYSLSIDSC
jgi:hypothetical protein